MMAQKIGANDTLCYSKCPTVVTRAEAEGLLSVSKRVDRRSVGGTKRSGAWGEFSIKGSWRNETEFRTSVE